MTNIAGITVTATNAIQSVVEIALPGTDFLSGAIRQVSTFGNEGIVAAVLIGLNFVLKMMPSVYDEIIPVFSLVTGTVLYPSLIGWSVRNGCIGFIAGVFVVGLVQAPKQLMKLKERFRTGDTQTIKKTDVQLPDKPPTE